MGMILTSKSALPPVEHRRASLTIAQPKSLSEIARRFGWWGKSFDRKNGFTYKIGSRVGHRGPGRIFIADLRMRNKNSAS
jgi:hypothetical protein